MALALLWKASKIGAKIGGLAGFTWSLSREIDGSASRERQRDEDDYGATVVAGPLQYLTFYGGMGALAGAATPSLVLISPAVGLWIWIRKSFGVKVAQA